MGLFGRDDQIEGSKPNNPEPQSRPKHIPGAGAPSTVIAASTHVEGEIKGSGDLRIEGSVKGTIDSSAAVLVTESGKLEGRVKAETVIVSGNVRGDAVAEQKIELTPSADMQGDLNAPRILIREGATFEGQVNMGTTKPAKKQPEPAAKNDTGKKPGEKSKATEKNDTK